MKIWGRSENFHFLEREVALADVGQKFFFWEEGRGGVCPIRWVNFQGG